ncbi:MAG TPA: SusD/RagB family nutrient-binding outer membrane lipoprotein, partial [Puia sp.]
NSTSQQQNPIWGNFGWTPGGSPNGNETYLVACSYIVNFWSSTNDTYRPNRVFCLNGSGVVRGRAFGSNNGAETSPSVVSLVGYAALPSSASDDTSGILTSPTAGALLFPAFESLFLQAEAAQRGFISGNADSLYDAAISENFRALGVANYGAAAQAYYTQSNPLTNITVASDPITTIITQKWASLIIYDPVESWCDWRRLGIPASLPVSIFPGTTATHIPYRLQYPSSEYKYNAVNIAPEGTIDVLTSKIFWMP